MALVSPVIPAQRFRLCPCRENAKLRHHPQLSSPGSTGRSSTPRPLGLTMTASGILDHPHARVMTPS
ncbi:hypothetical protein XH93_24420 [Bradyrhizobium sp. CCBAU 51753]|nr:hypothetical protein XH93_24420 [Bradyrhizobium sp. CCBAU 51753]